MSAANVIIGDGWAALATVGFLVQNQKPVVWITNTGARMFSALPSLDVQSMGNGQASEALLGSGVELWQRLARGFGVETGEPVSGSFLREFRNKAFREPAWSKAPTPELRQDVRKETLWAPERHLAPLWEARFPLSFNEIEHKIRVLLTSDCEEGAEWRKSIRRIDEIPVGQFKIEGNRICSVILGSGEEIVCDTVVYADRWDALPRIQGLPKNLPFIRGHEPDSVLQAIFGHENPVGAGLPEGFFGALHKESGEEFERHVWGHFASDGSQSYWTLCLTGDEVEDNHQIAKKLRRLKNALDKMFTGSSWLPEGKADFMSNVAGESVHFHEAVVFAGSDRSDQPVQIPQAQGLQFLTDGYGATSAVIQVARALGIPEVRLDLNPGLEFAQDASQGGPDSQAEDMNAENPSAS